MDDTKVTERLEVLKRDRQLYIIEAEKNIAAYNAVIAELERLLQPETPDEVQED